MYSYIQLAVTLNTEVGSTVQRRVERFLWVDILYSVGLRTDNQDTVHEDGDMKLDQYKHSVCQSVTSLL